MMGINNPFLVDFFSTQFGWQWASYVKATDQIPNKDYFAFQTTFTLR
jgi:hypothetical protein